MAKKRNDSEELTFTVESRFYNVGYHIDNNQLLLLVNLDEKPEGASKSGKTTLLASTHGNFKLPTGETMSVNVYVKPDKKKKAKPKDDKKTMTLR